jgi:hypothetical protein
LDENESSFVKNSRIKHKQQQQIYRQMAVAAMQMPPQSHQLITEQPPPPSSSSTLLPMLPQLPKLPLPWQQQQTPANFQTTTAGPDSLINSFMSRLAISSQQAPPIFTQTTTIASPQPILPIQKTVHPTINNNENMFLDSSSSQAFYSQQTVNLNQNHHHHHHQPSATAAPMSITYGFMKNTQQQQQLLQQQQQCNNGIFQAPPKFLMSSSAASALTSIYIPLIQQQQQPKLKLVNNNNNMQPMAPQLHSFLNDEIPRLYACEKRLNSVSTSPQESICLRMSDTSLPSVINREMSVMNARFEQISAMNDQGQLNANFSALMN